MEILYKFLLILSHLRKNFLCLHLNVHFTREIRENKIKIRLLFKKGRISAIHPAYLRIAGKVDVSRLSCFVFIHILEVLCLRKILLHSWKQRHHLSDALFEKREILIVILSDMSVFLIGRNEFNLHKDILFLYIFVLFPAVDAILHILQFKK